MLFYILKYKKPQSVRAYDINSDLINVYVQVQKKVLELMQELEVYQQEHNRSKDAKKYYYRRRRDYNMFKKDKIKRAALFIYLNKTCYNGLYRVNSKGEFNVPWNGEKTIRLYSKDSLIEASNLLNSEKVNIELQAKKFEDIEFDSLDTVYFDPPYWSEPEKNGFTSYSTSYFDLTMQEKLSELFFKLKKEGCKVILSNSDTKLINQLYDDSELKKFLISVRRMINCNGDGRHKINELLITANCENQTNDKR